MRGHVGACTKQHLDFGVFCRPKLTRILETKFIRNGGKASQWHTFRYVLMFFAKKHTLYLAPAGGIF